MASVTELWNWPATPATLSSWATLRSAAMPFSGVPLSSASTSWIGPGRLQLARKIPPWRLLAYSAPSCAPRRMSCPAAASPGGESGVTMPSLVGSPEAGGAAAGAACAAAGLGCAGAGLAPGLAPTEGLAAAEGLAAGPTAGAGLVTLAGGAAVGAGALVGWAVGAAGAHAATTRPSRPQPTPRQARRPIPSRPQARPLA